MPDIGTLPAPGEKPWNLNPAIETINAAVDDLYGATAGGTTGQVLTKASDDDHDFAWAPAGGVTGDGITHIEAITRTAYDALGSYDATTLYVIDEDA